MVYNDTVYLYTGRDDDGASYFEMNKWQVYSSVDMVNWTDHGTPLTFEDFTWTLPNSAWAAQCIERNGKFYWYVCCEYPGKWHTVGVAVSDSPTGPFRDAIGAPLFITGEMGEIDPSVFIDDDGQAYMVFGGIWGGQLEYWQSGEYNRRDTAPGGNNPALGPMIAKMDDDMLSYDGKPTEIQILDENGDPIPANSEKRRFFEGAWLHKYNGLYYLSYSTGTTHLLVYATSDDPMGPYTYRGKIMDPVKGWTTHHSIVFYDGQWYLFYHDALLSGHDSQRNIKYAPLYYNEDGTIQEVERP